MVWHAGWLQRCAECWYRKTCPGRAVIAFSPYLEIINLGIRLNLVGDYNHILLVLWKERKEVFFCHALCLDLLNPSQGGGMHVKYNMLNLGTSWNWLVLPDF